MSIKTQGTELLLHFLSLCIVLAARPPPPAGERVPKTEVIDRPHQSQQAILILIHKYYT